MRGQDQTPLLCLSNLDYENHSSRNLNSTREFKSTKGSLLLVELVSVVFLLVGFGRYWSVFDSLWSVF